MLQFIVLHFTVLDPVIITLMFKMYKCTHTQNCFFLTAAALVIFNRRLTNVLTD